MRQTIATIAGYLGTSSDVFDDAMGRCGIAHAELPMQIRPSATMRC